RMRRRRDVREVELGDFRDGGEDVVELLLEPLHLVLAQLEPREMRHLQQLFAIDLRHSPDPPKPEEAPVGAPSNSDPTGSLDGLDVRSLCALVALDDVERHTLAFGQRLVAIHRDRGEVDEDVVSPLTLDEAVALLVREPLDGALSQPFLLANNDGPGTEPPTFAGNAPSLAQLPADATAADLRSVAAVTVFWSTIAIVIGPTPPGTGVMYAARSSAPGSTSPSTFFPSPRFIPTSITVAPALTMSGETRCVRPTAATSTSASSVWRSRSCVREWQIVTVAFRCRSRCAIGFPTIAERPITTARAPSSGISYSSSMRMIPSGVPGTSVGRPR